MPTRRILWAALFASTFLYLLILFVVPLGANGEPNPIMPAAFAFVALTTIVVSFVLPAHMLAQGMSTRRFETTEAEKFSDVPAGTRFFANPEAARRSVEPSLQTMFILRMALYESIAIYGFVLGFLGNPIPVFIGFFVVAWALMALQFPTQDRDDAALTKATGIRFR